MTRRRHTTFVCDGCQAEHEGQKPETWLTVTRASDPFDSAVEGLDWWDFCSYACLAIWATARGQKVEQRR
jgi:hypothetical protein